MNHKERRIALFMLVIFASITVLLAQWFYTKYITSWYHGVINRDFLPVTGIVNNCKAYSLQTKTSIRTYHATCYFEIKDSSGLSHLAEVDIPNEYLKDVNQIQKKVDSIYSKNERVSLLINPKNRNEVILNYANIKFTGWFKITIGSILFCVVWIPCLVVSIVAFRGIVKKQSN